MQGRDRVELKTLREGSVTALPGWRATADQRHGALPAARATALIRGLERDGDRSRLVALHDLATGTEPGAPNRLSISKLVDTVRAALESGKLLILAGEADERSSEVAPAPGGSKVSAEQRLISGLMTGRAALSLDGVRYRLVAAAAGAAVRGHNEYSSVPSAEASELVKRLAEATARSPADRAAWAEVREAVSRADAQARIVLLRPRPASFVPAPLPAAPAPAPAARPAVAIQTWIEIEILFEDGTPFTGNCVVELPGGVRSEGAPDGEGIVRIERIDPGTCKVSLPELDAPAWKAA
jgi:hypothetical protein